MTQTRAFHWNTVTEHLTKVQNKAIQEGEKFLNEWELQSQNRRFSQNRFPAAVWNFKDFVKWVVLVIDL